MHRKRIVVIIAIAAAVLFGWNTYQQQRLATDNKDQSAQIGAQQQLIDGLADQLDEAADQGADVATPEEVAETVDGAEVSAVGPQGERGPIGETGAAGPAGVGPTDAQIEAAIAIYCSTRNQCREPISQADIVAAVTAYCLPDGCRGFEGALGSVGPPGQDGEPGRPPTADEIEAAVYAYLASNPPVAGSPGPQGSQGSQGEPGPGPTAEQIGAAVDSYCSTGACVGPIGPQGSQGAAGTPAREVVDVIVTCSQSSPVDPIQCSSTVVYGP